MKRSRRKEKLQNTACRSVLEILETRILYSVHNDSFDVTNLTELRDTPEYSSITGKGVAIAVLDTGVDAANPDLTSKVVAYYNAVEDAIPSSISSSSVSSAVDNDGHGTHTSGIAASADPNIGVAYGANLVDVKVIADSGESELSGDPLLRGLEFVQDFASQFNIKVVSMSLGYVTSSGGVNENTVPAADDISREIQTLEGLGITVVAAAGNSYANDPTPGESYPAVVSTISVGSVWSDTGSGYDFNTYSWGTDYDSWAAVESSAVADQISATSQRSTLSNMILAPGVNIYSDWNGTSTDNSGSDLLHNTLSGTSMATPFVAGVVALMQQAAYTYGGRYITDPQEVLSIIKETSDVVTDPVSNYGDTRIPISNGQATGGSSEALPGTGDTFDRVDVFKAIQAVQALFTGTISNSDIDNTTTTATTVPILDGTADYTESGNIGTDGLNQVGANDVDLYKLVLSETGSLTAALSQPSGGTAFIATLRLFDANGNQIQIAEGTSSAGYPTITTASGSPLAVGTYYLGVSSAGNNAYSITDGSGKTGGSTTGDYSLTLSLSNPDPNGVPQGAVAVDLTQPNYEFTDNSVGNLYNGILGSDPPPTGSSLRVSVPNGDVDMFKIVAPDTGLLTAQTDATNYGFTGADTYIEVLDSNLNVIDSAGVNNGGFASNASVQFDVTIGQTYYVAVTVDANANFNVTDPYSRATGSTASATNYDLYLKFDNGNTDGTALLANTKTIGTTVSGDIGSSNASLGASSGFKYVDWYTYTAGTAGLLDLTATATSSGFSPSVELWTLSTNSAGSTVIVEVGGVSGSGQSLVDAVTAGETVYVSVTGLGNSNFNWESLGSGSGGETGTYSMTSALLNPDTASSEALNDNSIDYGVPGTITAGQAVTGNIGYDNGLIQGSTDVDLYKFVPTTSGAYDIETNTSQEGSADTYLRLFDSSGNQLAANDNATSATTASLIRANLVAGQTYYIGVSGTGNDSYSAVSGSGATASTTSGTYGLMVSLANVPAITVNNPAAVSPTAGGTTLDFTVSLDFAATSLVTVDYTTADGTATAGTDYTATSGQLTFEPGQTSQTVSVPILVNSNATGLTTFSLDLSSPSSNAIIDGGQGTGTISNLPVTKLDFSNGKHATYTDSFGRSVELVLSGPGSGVISDIGSGTEVEVTVTGTTNKSHLTVISSAKEDTVLSSMAITGSLASLSAPHVELEGNLTVSGTIGSLVLAGASGSGTLSIDGTGTNGIVQLGNVSDLTLMSSEPLAELAATNWTNLSNSDSITAPLIKLLKTTGAFGAAITAGTGTTALDAVRIGGAITGGAWNINGGAGSIVAGSTALSWSGNFSAGINTLQVSGDSNGSITAAYIKALRVGGNVSSASWDFTSAGTLRSPDLGSVSVAGLFSNSELKSAGDINSIHLGAISGSTIDAGTTATGLASYPDFTSESVINSVAVTGVRGQTYAFTDSVINAFDMGSVLVERVQYSNSGTLFGFTTTALKTFTDLEPGKKPVRWTKADSLAVLNAYTQTGDFRVYLTQNG